jgi:hypothetical protein
MVVKNILEHALCVFIVHTFYTFLDHRLYKLNKIQYYREHLEDSEEMFLKGAEIVYGKLKTTYPNTILLLELVPCDEDKTEWVYDLSAYEEKKVIALRVTHPVFKKKQIEKPMMILPNQTVYIFESGAVLWRTF